MSAAIDLSKFEVKEVLRDEPSQNTIVLLGSFKGKQDQAIITLSRRQFGTDALRALLDGAVLGTLQFQNDIYSKYDASVPPDQALVNVDVTFPATEKHIRKARVQQYTMIRESPEMYEEQVLPHIEAIPAAHIQWVYNILDKKAEAERLLFEDPDPETGFMLHPDLKWDQGQLTNLYCVAICHTRKVRSLRDLTAEQLPMLRNIRDKASQAIHDKFPTVKPDQLRHFVHYQPSYYHFHVHIVHVNFAHPGANVGKAHLLDDIIDNLNTIGGDYYQRRTLTYTLGANDALMDRLRKRKAASEAVA